MYGANGGRVLERADAAKQVAASAASSDFDLQQFAFSAAPEQLRPPRIVRIGLIQHSIAVETTQPYAVQRQVGQLLGHHAAHRSGLARALQFDYVHRYIEERCH